MARLVSLASREPGAAPLALRRRNLIALAEMPYPLAPVRPNDGFGNTACDSGDYASAFDRSLAQAARAEKASLQGKLIEGRYHGLGIACFIEGGGSGPREHARMTVEPDGSVCVAVGSAAVGAGVG